MIENKCKPNFHVWTRFQKDDDTVFRCKVCGLIGMI